MKLYNFEKHYLYLARYKGFMFLKKVLSTDAGVFIFAIVLFFILLFIICFILDYFLIGVDVFLIKTHLKEPLMQKVSLIKPYIDSFIAE